MIDPDLVDMPRISSTTPKGDDFAYVDGNTLSTQKSSEMLYMVLGIVLGVMMLLLLVFMAMCAWKQRQQRRLMSKLFLSFCVMITKVVGSNLILIMVI